MALPDQSRVPACAEHEPCRMASWWRPARRRSPCRLRVRVMRARRLAATVKERSAIINCPAEVLVKRPKLSQQGFACRHSTEAWTWWPRARSPSSRALWGGRGRSPSFGVGSAGHRRFPGLGFRARRQHWGRGRGCEDGGDSLVAAQRHGARGSGAGAGALPALEGGAWRGRGGELDGRAGPVADAPRRRRSGIQRGGVRGAVFRAGHEATAADGLAEGVAGAVVGDDVRLFREAKLNSPAASVAVTVTSICAPTSSQGR